MTDRPVSGRSGRRAGPIRHAAWVRAAHGINAAAFLALAASGTAILLALPRLFWGETGANGAPALLVLPLPVNLEQTGWGRNLHFLAAWVFVLNGGLYLLLSVLGGHLRRRLLPDADQIRPGHLAREVRAHLNPRGSDRERAPARYNALQKFAYLAVIFGLSPLMLLTGLTMSPGVTAAFPELFALFGGRQSARTLHVLCASLLMLFLAVHLRQVFANGPAALIRGITVGRGERR